jgi:hypothetical protein
MKHTDLPSPEHLALMLQTRMLQTRTISECPLRRTEPSLAHSKGKPAAPPKKTNIRVRFAEPLAAEISIHVVAAQIERQEPTEPDTRETDEIFVASPS